MLASLLSFSCGSKVSAYALLPTQSTHSGYRFIDSPVDPSDTMLGHYLIATWAKVCQAMGPEFEPYLPVVMPPLLLAASAKADVSVYGTYSFVHTSFAVSFTFP